MTFADFERLFQTVSPIRSPLPFVCLHSSASPDFSVPSPPFLPPSPPLSDDVFLSFSGLLVLVPLPACDKDAPTRLVLFRWLANQIDGDSFFFFFFFPHYRV